MQDQNETSILENIQVPIKRRTLLPWWIKVLCWIYMATVIAVISVGLIYLVGGIEQKKVFGNYIVAYSSWVGVILLFIIAYNGFAAWALWVGKIYAVKIAIEGAYLKIIGNLLSIFVLPYIIKGYHYQSGFQFIILAFYLSKLFKIRRLWEDTFTTI